MKKLAGLILILSLTGMVSCKKVQDIFGGSKKKEAVEGMYASNLALQNKIKEDSLMHLQELNMLREQYEAEITRLSASPSAQAGVKNYYVVVGSFKKPVNAESYAAKIKSMGYEGAIVDGPNYFTLVTSATHSDLRSAISGQSAARDKISEESWVYIK
jgi:hypothetical protein